MGRSLTETPALAILAWTTWQQGTGQTKDIEHEHPILNPYYAHPFHIRHNPFSIVHLFLLMICHSIYSFELASLSFLL
jgi:hypothetical protein